MKFLFLTLLTLFVIYLFLIASRRYGKKRFSRLMGYDYAHRGLHDNAGDPPVRPENSMAAFAAAVEAGYGIELDIQLSRDRKMVVFHDDTLDRICGVHGRVDSFTYEELKHFPLLKSEEHIPLFTDVLELVDGKVPLIVELKMSPVKNFPVCEKAAAILRDYHGPYCIESFSPFAVQWFRRYRPGVIRGQLSGDLFKEAKNGAQNLGSFALTHLLTNFFGRPDFIAYDHTAAVGKPSLWLCRKLFGTLPVAWTIKSQEEYDRAKKTFSLMIFEGFRPAERKEDSL